MKRKKYTFIDLFAGLGGFHLALESLGCKCVFASELRDYLRKLYSINFPGARIEGDITAIEPSSIPAHDILCAGFPCQPFSQAGKRQGFNDEKDRGNLFYYICEIVKFHRPKYIFLENVSNLKGHDNGHTWEVIQQRLEDLNYDIKAEIISPHSFGIPQHRKRIYIVCINKDYGTLDYFDFPKGENGDDCNISSIIDEKDTDVTKLKEDTRQQLAVWQEFMDKTVSSGDKIPRFPIWAMEFGATYDFEEVAPAFQKMSDLKGKKGKLGTTICGSNMESCLQQLPIYAQTSKDKIFPRWKISYIKSNREFYNKHKSWLDIWLKKIENFENSHMKFEWNCGDQSEPTLFDKIVQFRASGIRVKLPTFSPALNLVGTQIPIFPWVKLPSSILEGDEPKFGRYMTLKEAARIQGMQDLVFSNDDFKLSTTRSYDALGNAVNVEIVKLIAKKLLRYA